MPFVKPQKYTSLILDHDMDVRMRIREAMNAATQFGEKRQVNYLTEGIRELDAGYTVDLVFISYRFTQEEIIQFIEAAKKLPQALDAAFILLLEKEKEQEIRLAPKLLLGADGLLFEPYSVEDFVAATVIADHVKRLHLVDREIESLRFLIKGIIKYVDLIAKLKASDMPTDRVEKKLHEVCKVLHEFQPESIDEYHRLATEYFDRVAIPGIDAQGKPFVSVSKRIRRRVEKLMLDEATEKLSKE